MKSVSGNTLITDKTQGAAYTLGKTDVNEVKEVFKKIRSQRIG